MSRTIIVYGNGDTRPNGVGFPTPDDFTAFIREGVFQDCACRYRYTQGKAADVIVLSRRGLIYGRFEVSGKEKPTPQDVEEYDRTKAVYIITSSILYERPVPLADVGITGIQFGRSITEEQLTAIETRAGTRTSHSPG